MRVLRGGGFKVYCNRVSVPPVRLLASETNRWRKKKLLERLKIRKPPTEFQDVCLKTLCAVRDFNVEGQAICCAQGFSL